MRWFRLRSAFSLVFVTALVAGTAAAQQAVDLRPKLVAGKQANFRWSSETEQTTTAGPEAKPAQAKKGSTSLEFSLSVTKADAAGTEVELQLKSIKVTADLPAGPESYDSTAPTTAGKPNFLATAYEPLVGLRLQLKLDLNGKIVDISGTDYLPRGPGEAGQARMRWLDKPLIIARFGPIFSSGSASDSVSVGSNWTTEEHFPLSAYGNIAITLVHTLAAADDTGATIAVKGHAETELNAGPDAAKIKSQTGDIQRTVTWDPKAGMIKKLESQQNLAVELQNPTSSVIIGAKSKTTIERVD